MVLDLFSGLFKKRPYKTGIILGGGGTRGFAHLGVLQALHEKEISVDAISGVSAGAIIGGLVAAGKSPIEVMTVMSSQKLMDFTSLSFPKTGLLKLDKLGQFLKEQLGETSSFEKLQTPFWVALSNLNKGKVEYHNSGDLITKILASAAIPILFSPVIIGQTTYVDGGLFDNLPVAPLQDKCKKLIGVNISPVQEVDDFSNIIDIAARTFQLNDKSNTRKNSRLCSVLIQPPELGKYDLLDTSNAQKLFDIGYEHTMKIDF
ncbi:patatin-like phospholipase family protein [Flagellimonas allohymeniacidonis]|uniref:Patatin n=1 Tax=Flagellimonas allohymeniacidonis TaxID=2517819 RepID=A0A4Q8QL02_9FLAO|nr:patatin-like phospholipase family protein [Allomuricauda hymeniacidonis]TAI49493.1 patatin [Allomuricauda hymeniacidonis]